ncbi:hypothetical protein KDH_50620 [Dictyobacter sp. S3.2.2.5]|uniref:H repeat-associated protein N-terminal domain-containing protein n=1 Tax=Dictyobacter halimunensis TaxID=3026934 RepID=A0ABQ6G0A8_9CHLR|nr:hypothetical protein KDH_50620 [Dictyobacter sp. S3.2.2.5]
MISWPIFPKQYNKKQGHHYDLAVVPLLFIGFLFHMNAHALQEAAADLGTMLDGHATRDKMRI